ncbi:hypothetical protein OZ410_11420 [Robiginitalea sp. M366]|uniref:hypothetical protein n=1 Tax=Robiginitalea aestuariiviva TaxID=3036903 RepID=UPI00240CEA13|nr:hypothetical protein [Robiginitalea aestuariiviva]MDG1572927.1 hypothetical protein [Robiginitalea aestuariiviva]
MMGTLMGTLPVLGQESAEKQVSGSFSGEWRTYYMQTVNKGALQDFQALATGGHLAYTLRLGKSWELGAALYKTTDLGLGQWNTPDPQTGKASRYEEGLFNRLEPSADMVLLLGNLYLDYHHKGHAIRLGRMKVNTPLINSQDGRMIPTLVEGLWYAYQFPDRYGWQLGIVNRIAPRSTGDFMGIGESIGAYPAGRDPEGRTSLYPGHTRSDVVVVAHGQVRPMESLQLLAWNYYIENVSNSFYLKSQISLGGPWEVAAEWLHQNRLGEGGNGLDSLRYFDQARADLLGVQLRYGNNKSGASLAYDHILPHGRFLFPREWGREELFSFQKRERSEGSAQNHALVITYRKPLVVKKDEATVQAILSAGRHWKPPVQDPALNKYAFPDYTHLNLDFFLTLQDFPGFRPELLLTFKRAHGDLPDNPNLFFNKADLFHMSLVFNYRF